MQPRVLAIVGVGLIGGSVALASRRAGVGRVLGVDRDARILGRAVERGVIDEAFTDITAAASAADVMLFCTPVDVIAEQVIAAASACRPGAILTDAGSTKENIVRAVTGRLPAGVAFVGGHPLAGSQKQGLEHADVDLFRDRVVVLTLTTDEPAVHRIQSFWESLGAKVRLLSPEAHDRAVAVTSHLPHLVASALAGVLPAEFGGLTATGFRDTTRIAEGDADLWSAILSANRVEVLGALGRFEQRLAEFRAALEAGDREILRGLLAAGREVRKGILRNP